MSDSKNPEIKENNGQDEQKGKNRRRICNGAVLAAVAALALIAGASASARSPEPAQAREKSEAKTEVTAETEEPVAAEEAGTPQKELPKKQEGADFAIIPGLEGARAEAKKELQGGVEVCLQELTDARAQEEPEEEIILTALGNYSPSAQIRAGIEEAILAARELGREMGFVMLDIRSGEGLCYNQETPFYAASAIKGPYVTAVARKTPEILDGEPYTLQSILVQSSNNSYDSLFARYGPEPLRNLAEDVGFELHMTDYSYSDFTAEELARLWLGCYEVFENDERGEELGAFYEEPAYSVIYSCLSDESTTRSKGGWLVEYGYCATCDAGLVYAGNRPYLLVILSDFPQNMEKLEPIVLALDAAHQDILS